MSVTSENEALKLSASLLNSIAAALVGAGIILPLLNQVVGSNPLAIPILITLIGSCAIGAACLHSSG